jgi:hypothetical protein
VADQEVHPEELEEAHRLVGDSMKQKHTRETKRRSSRTQQPSQMIGITGTIEIQSSPCMTADGAIVYDRSILEVSWNGMTPMAVPLPKEFTEGLIALLPDQPKVVQTPTPKNEEEPVIAAAKRKQKKTKRLE